MNKYYKEWITWPVSVICLIGFIVSGMIYFNRIDDKVGSETKNYINLYNGTHASQLIEYIKDNGQLPWVIVLYTSTMLFDVFGKLSLNCHTNDLLSYCRLHVPFLITLFTGVAMFSTIILIGCSMNIFEEDSKQNITSGWKTYNDPSHFLPELSCEKNDYKYMIYDNYTADGCFVYGLVPGGKYNVVTLCCAALDRQTSGIPEIVSDLNHYSMIYIWAPLVLFAFDCILSVIVFCSKCKCNCKCGTSASPVCYSSTQIVNFIYR